MKTDELRSQYPGKSIHFNCKDGDEAFPDGYVLWLEKGYMDKVELIEQLIKNYEDKKLEEFRLAHINDSPSYSFKNLKLLITSYNSIIQDLKKLIK